MLNRIARIALLIATGLGADDLSFTGISQLATLSQDYATPGFSNEGKPNLVTRQAWIDLRRSDGLPQSGALLVVFDAAAGVFWWDLSLFRVQEGRAEADAEAADLVRAMGRDIRFYSGDGRIVAFDARVSFILVRESTARAVSLDDAEGKAFAMAKAALLAGRPVTATMHIDALHGVWESELSEPGSAQGPLLHFEAASRRGGEWVLTVRGRTTVRLVLNERYELKKWDRVAE